MHHRIVCFPSKSNPAVAFAFSGNKQTDATYNWYASVYKHPSCHHFYSVSLSLSISLRLKLFLPRLFERSSPLSFSSWWESAFHPCTQIGMALRLCPPNPLWGICRRAAWLRFSAIWTRRRFVNCLGWIGPSAALPGPILFGNQSCRRIMKLLLGKSSMIFRAIRAREEFILGYVG